MKDIVFPKGNEKEFIRTAKTLGYDSLILAYSDPKDFFKEKAEIRIKNALLSPPNKVISAKGKSELVFVKSSENDRSVIEQKPDLIFGLEQSPKYDALHFRASGLNNVLAKLCSDNNVEVGFSFTSLLNAGPEKRSVVMGRISQNIRLCRKAKAEMLIASFATRPEEMRNPADLISLFKLLGMNEGEIRNALS